MLDPIENVKLSVGNNIRQWIITVVGPEGTVYAGEKFRLKFSFPSDYPFSPPSVYFLQPIPKHEHVYSNGDICLDLLGEFFFE
jgi:ubiquitin-conjugating enzyme E2 W